MAEQRTYSSPFRRLLPSAGLATVMALGACGDGSDAPTVPPAPTPPPTPPPPALNLPDDPDAVVLEVWVHRGPPMPHELTLGGPPLYWLTAGGDLYAEGPMMEIWPQRLLPNLLATALDDADFNAALEDIAASTLPDVDDLHITEPTGQLADAPLTEFYLNDTTGTHVIRVEGLWAGEHLDPRVASLKALVDRLGAATETAGAYRGDRVQVIVGFDFPPPLHPEDKDERDWPLPDPPARSDDGAFPCHVFDGATATRLLELFGNAHVATRWVWEDERIFLFARELFPGEDGCREQ